MKDELQFECPRWKITWVFFIYNKNKIFNFYWNLDQIKTKRIEFLAEASTQNWNEFEYKLHVNCIKMPAKNCIRINEVVLEKSLKTRFWKKSRMVLRAQIFKTLSTKLLLRSIWNFSANSRNMVEFNKTMTGLNLHFFQFWYWPNSKT